MHLCSPLLAFVLATVENKGGKEGEVKLYPTKLKLHFKLL